jgi:electron transport complex protein RnfA
MTDLLLIAVAAATVNNVALVWLLGLGPVLASSGDVAGARGVSPATTAALTVTCGLSWLLEQWVLVPRGLGWLRIVSVVVISILAVHGINRLHPQPAARLPLNTINCMVLGVALLATGTATSLAGVLVLGLGAGLGFGLVLLLYGGLQSRLAGAPVPAALRGPGIALLTFGMMSLAVLGFSGIGT